MDYLGRQMAVSDCGILDNGELITYKFFVLNNDSYYKNPKVDELFDKAAAEPNPQKRAALYKELQDTVNADSPWAPLVFEMMTAGAVKPLKNFAVLPDGSFDFYQADWQE